MAVDGRTLNVDYAGELASGREQGNILKNQRLAGELTQQKIGQGQADLARSNQFDKLAGNLATGQFPEGEDWNTTTSQLLINNGEKAKSLLNSINVNNQLEAEDASTAAYIAQNTPPEMQDQVIQQESDKLRSQGKTKQADVVASFLQVPPEHRDKFFNVTQWATQGTAKFLEHQKGGKSGKPGEGQFSIGNTRYNPDGSVLVQGESTPTKETKTASSKDFETYQELNAKAKRTGDPIDIELAEKFGTQAGFDRLSPQELADIEVDKTSQITLGKQAAAASKEAFDSLKGVRSTIANIDDAIRVLDVEGAETGPIISKLPSFRQAAIELDNIKGRMGLDVISSVTFGALSESELAFALDTALPTNLEPAALKDWLVRKRDAQKKLANELRKAASFLGTPGNTIAMYVDKMESEGAAKDPANATDNELKKRLGL